MFKKLIETYLKNRLNYIDEEIERLSIKYAEDIQNQSVIQRATKELNKDIQKDIIKLQSRAFILNMVFGSLWREEV